jgi:3-methyladenine DNA glycosylase AlkD
MSGRPYRTPVHREGSSMNKIEVMQRLKAVSNERYRHTLLRNGVSGTAFGVSYAELYKLQKQLGTDQELAEQLWEMHNHDARILATLIADPARMTVSKLDQWVKAATNQIMRDAIGNVAINSKSGRRCAEKWITHKTDGIAACGWGVLGALAERPDVFTNAELIRYLKQIRKEIGGERNRVKHGMNQTIIGIGVRNPEMRKLALDVAEAIGKVVVDHGETSCKTPDAGAYILKVLAHRRKMNKETIAAPSKKPAARKAASKKPAARTGAARKAPRKRAAAR